MWCCYQHCAITSRISSKFIQTYQKLTIQENIGNWCEKNSELWSRIHVLHLQVPTEIFGQKLNEKWRFYHGSDFCRIRILMEYGGIYLDNDSFVIRSLNKYRKFECVVNWDENQSIGNQVIIAHKNSRFLQLWLDSYRFYRSDLWYYNGGEKPAELLKQHPELIHRVKGNFGADTGISQRLYKNRQHRWRQLDAIHLLINHRYYLDPNFSKIPVFDEINIQTYEYPFGEMAREVLNHFKDIV